MASVSPSLPSCSTIRTPVRRSPAFAVSELRRFKQRRPVLPPVAVSIGHVADVVRNDVEFLKNKIGIGIKWANVAFRVPEVTKSAEEVFWLRHLEDSASPPLEKPSLPQPSYSGLTGVDLLMADVKALEAYAGYIYCLSKMWSRPLPEVYDPQAVADYFNCRPHVVAFRLLEVFSAFMIAAIRLKTSESDKGKKLEASGQKFDIRVYADELGKGLAGELDFTLEAANACEFREAHSRFSYIRVPKVCHHLTRKRVLTMEWMVGESPTDLESISTGYSETDTQSDERQKLEAIWCDPVRSPSIIMPTLALFFFCLFLI